MIIKSIDKRQRYRFVQGPLEATGQKVDVINQNTLRCSILNLSFRRSQYKTYDCAIIFDTNITSMYDLILLKMAYRLPVFVRLGGDPKETRADYLYSLWKNRCFLRFLKIGIDYLLTDFVIKKAAVCITVSEALSKRMRDLYKANKIITLPIPMDAKKLEYKDRSSEHSIRLLSVINLNYRKKFEAITKLLRLMNTAPLDELKYTWRIVGGGLYEKELEKEIASFPNLSGTLNYLGVSNNVESHYRWADVFLYASRMDWLPNVLIEAKSYGLPVILDDYEPLRHIFRHGGARFFDAVTGAGFISSLVELSRFSVRKELGMHNHEDIQNRFCASVIGKEFIEKVSFSTAPLTIHW